jgi:hypothetical protein
MDPLGAVPRVSATDPKTLIAHRAPTLVKFERLFEIIKRFFEIPTSPATFPLEWRNGLNGNEATH